MQSYRGLNWQIDYACSNEYAIKQKCLLKDISHSEMHKLTNYEKQYNPLLKCNFLRYLGCTF